MSAEYESGLEAIKDEIYEKIDKNCDDLGLIKNRISRIESSLEKLSEHITKLSDSSITFYQGFQKVESEGRDGRWMTRLFILLAIFAGFTYVNYRMQSFEKHQHGNPVPQRTDSWLN